MPLRTLLLLCISTAAVIIVGLPKQLLVAAEGPKWIRDVEDGKKQARAAAKDLFIVFTGHGWCAHCEILDREVFQQAEFVRSASKDYVFVELDFNFGDSPQEQERQKHYRELQNKYLIRVFPTVVLADADGVPYAMMTGYSTGRGPTKTLAKIRLARVAKKQRDRQFELAKSSTGIERVAHFHKGIQSVATLLGSLDERGDDPVLVFYKRQVDEILRSDKTKLATIRRNYEGRIRKRDEWMARESVFSKLKAFRAAKDYQGGIDYIADVLKNVEDRDVRWRLERSRQTYLEWDRQHDEALKNARRLLNQAGLADADRENLLDREAYNLFNLGRIDEGLAHYDRQIEAADGNPKKQLRLLGSKAQMILNRDRLRQSIDAWRAYREATKAGTEDWLDATALLARQYQKAGEHRRALELFGKFLELDKYSGIMLDAAESHIALGQHEQARIMIGQAQSAIGPLKRSARKSEKEEAARAEKRIDGLRAKLGTNNGRKN